MTARVSGIGITNNLFGEGHLPYADNPDGGLLGVYVTVAQDRSELAAHSSVNMARGKLARPTIRSKSTRRSGGSGAEPAVVAPQRFRCVIDGELSPPLKREDPVSRIHKKRSNVLMPGAAQGIKAA